MADLIRCHYAKCKMRIPETKALKQETHWFCSGRCYSLWHEADRRQSQAVFDALPLTEFRFRS